MNPVIIIFGAAVRADGRPSGAMRSRVDAAVACASRLTEAVFMPTGGQGRYGPPEAAAMRRLLEERGVAAARIREEPTGTNTLRSALACARLLRGHAGPVYVATSAYHLTRCVLLLRLAGVPARPCRAAKVPASTRRWRRWRWRLRELPALPVDACLMVYLRLRGRT